MLLSDYYIRIQIIAFMPWKLISVFKFIIFYNKYERK